MTLRQHAAKPVAETRGRGLVATRSIAAVLCMLAGAFAEAAPSIEVDPPRVLEGEPVHVRLVGLAPGSIATLRVARLHDRFPSGTEPYHGQATFVVPGDGVVDLRRDAPRDGSSWAGVDPAGPFWSMRPARLTGVSATAPTEPGEVRIVLETGGSVVARSRVVLGDVAGGVGVRDVRDDGVVGVFAMRRGTRPGGAGVIVLGGSEGGLHTARGIAPLLASHGFTALGVGYFRGTEDDPQLPPDLEHVPVETIDAAVRWLVRHAGVDADRIALVGVSKGAELALVAAAHRPRIRAVAAFAPSDVVWEGIGRDASAPAGSSWSLEGRPLPFVRWSFAAHRRSEAARRATGSSRMVETHLASLAEHAQDVPAATIAVERSDAAVFLAAGIDDGMWPSAAAAERIAARLAAARHPRTVRLELVDTGHQVLGTGWAPTTAFNRPTGRLQGGNPALDARAQSALWRKLLAFLGDELR